MLKNSKGYVFTLLKKPQGFQQTNNAIVQALNSSFLMGAVTQN